MASDGFERDIPLPDELLSKIIFKFVPLYQWSNSLEFVSKQFQLCVLIAYGRLKYVNFRTLFALKKSRKNLEALLSVENWEMSTNILFLEERSSSARLNNILKKLLSVCPNLTSVTGFEFITHTVDSETWNTLKQFDRLESVSLEYAGCYEKVASEPVGDFVACCKSLKYLNISHCDFDVGWSLDVSSLACVDIDGTFSDSAIFLANISEKLTSLTIRSFQWNFRDTNHAIQQMQMCVNLESLSMCLDNMVDYNVLFNTLPGLCKLTTLRVSGGKGRLAKSAFGEQFCVQLESIKNQLKCVEFCGIALRDEAQKFFFTKCPNLESFKFNSCHSELSVNAFEDLPKLPVNFNKLTIIDPSGEIFRHLLPNLAGLSNFTELNICRDSFNYLFSEEWENICYLDSLQYLQLAGDGIDDSMLEKWDKKNGKMFEKLISLIIPGCVGISDVGGCLLAKKAKNLKNLNLNSSRISEKTISIFADIAKQLTTISFAQNLLVLYDENAILLLIKKLICLEKVEFDEKMAKNLIKHKEFLPFVDYVEICWF